METEITNNNKEKDEIEKEEIENEEIEKEEKEHVSIPKWEIIIVFIVWFSVYGYTWYITNKLAFNKINFQHFKRNGLFFKDNFGLYKSRMEWMWNYTYDLLFNGMQYYMIFMVLSVGFRKLFSAKVYLVLAMLSSMSIVLYLSSWKFFIHLWSFYWILVIVALLRNRILVWIGGILLMYFYRSQMEEYSSSYLFTTGYSFGYLLISRAIAAGLYICSRDKFSIDLLLETNHYYWYFLGVIECKFMTIKNFIEQIYNPVSVPSYSRWFLTLFKVFIYFILWNYVVSKVPLHLVLNHFDLTMLPPSVLMFCVYQIGLDHFMYVYVLVTFSYLLMLLDGYDTAKGPTCIAHITLYARQWREFDRGLHYWIKENVFRPVAFYGQHKSWRYIAALLSFGYVWIFFSYKFDAGVYVCINFVEYFVEKICKYLYNNTKLGSFVKSKLSPVNEKRLMGAFGGLAFSFSSVSYASLYISYNISVERLNVLFIRNIEGRLFRLMQYIFLLYVSGSMSLYINDKLERRNKKKID